MLKELYAQYRSSFQYQRKLCEIGSKLVLIPMTPDEERKVFKRYKAEDIQWLRDYLKRRRR